MLDPHKTPDEYADAYVHLLLSQEEAVAFEARCDEEKEYRDALERAQKRKELLESAPPAEASEKLVRQTIDRIHHKVDRRVRVWKIYSRSVLALTAAAVVLIAAFHAYYYNLRPTPYDVRILGQNELLAGTNAAIRVAVFNERTGEEFTGVPVGLTIVDRTSGETAELGSFVSGENVAAQLQLPDWKEGKYDLRIVARPAGGREVLTKSVRLTRQWKLMLSSDKPIYQPGQTIHLRALALRKPDLKPVTGEQMTFTISDPKGNVIFKREATGSRFGIAAADCALATEIIEGPYNIECRIGDTTSEKTVKVEKYVLPKFSIGITLDKPFYQPGGPVSGTVQADYFFGQPVAGGEVNIDVRTTDVRPFSIASIIEKTDDQGRASFRFTLPQSLIGREQHDGHAQFALVATVTDTAGQTYSRGVKRIVTARPIQLEVIPESGTLVQGVANKVYIFASYADGRPAAVDLTINGTEKTKTNKLGVAEIELTPQTNSLGLTLVARDDEGRVGRKHVKLAAGQVAGDFVVRTDKATYNGGETMTLTVLGGGVEPVFVDLIKDGQTMLTTTVDVSGGKGQTQIDLPAEIFGTIKLVAYRFGQGGLAVRKTKMLFVRQARQLKVAATLDQDEYRPGVSARLKLKLTDEEGHAVPGAISLAAVDEAVFAVLGQRPGMEEVFFLLEEELLEPVYAIYNWDPFAEGEVPPDEVTQLEQALFSRTASVAAGGRAVPREFVAAERDGRADTVEVFAPGVEGTDFARGDESPYSLAAASYPQKRDRVFRQRNAGLRGSIIAWWTLLGSLVIVGITTFAVYRPKAFFITAAFITAAILLFLALPLICVMMFPPINAAREAARRGGGDAMMDFAAGTEADAGEAPWNAAPGATVETAAPLEPESTPGTDEPDEPAGPPAPRVREWFPETLLWRPQIVTNDNGEATLEIPLADSITTWRVTTSAVSGRGQLGGDQFPIRVFQPFFVDLDLPVALTRNDQVSVPVVVYNYLDEAQEVELTLKDADWFTRLDAAGAEVETNEPLTLKLEPREIRSLHIPLRVEKVGRQKLQVTAIGSGMSDAIRREIEVVPDGRRVEQIVSGSLSDPAEMTLSLPADTIEGSPRAIVKLYPSTFSQLVEGLDGIFRMPSGCFEQTSSTTYPNVLALDYLRRTKMNAPDVEAKARQYIHTGYQRLVSFEVTGGGFDWFGRPPANETLTAYGLMEFEDMARVHDVDPRLIERTRNWLLARRQGDGRWKADAGMLNDGLAGSVLSGDDLDLANTAYVAWAVFGSGNATGRAQITLDYLLAHEPASIDSPYILAIIANCIAGIDSNHSSLGEYLGRLDGMKQTSEDGKQIWWKQAEGGRTMFYGSGRSGDIETTAMAVLALMKSGQYSASVKGALTWLIEQKDGSGTWHSTQATVLALKALVEATGSPLGGEKARKIDIALDGKVVRTVDIPVDQAEVMQQINLTEHLAVGEQQLTITDRTDTSTGYQIAFWYHVDEVAPPPVDAPTEPLSINIAYDRERLQVDDTVTATAVAVNNMDAAAPMVILDLPIPGGFKIEPGELDELVGSNKIAKYQITARKAIVYLRGLQPGQQLELRYRLKATMPVKVAVPPGTAYEYYNPDRRGTSKPALLEAAIDA